MEFLSQHNIDFVAKNVRGDFAALRELVTHGSRTTPTTVIDGEVIIGFDRERIKRLLEL